MPLATGIGLGPSFILVLPGPGGGINVILKEDGDAILTESGDLILIE